MRVESILTTGLRDTLERLNRGAEKVNRDEIPEGLIEMRQAVRQAQLNIAALRTNNEMNRTLLDIYG